MMERRKGEDLRIGDSVSTLAWRLAEYDGNLPIGVGKILSIHGESGQYARVEFRNGIFVIPVEFLYEHDY